MADGQCRYCWEERLYPPKVLAHLRANGDLSALSTAAVQAERASGRHHEGHHLVGARAAPFPRT